MEISKAFFFFFLFTTETNENRSIRNLLRDGQALNLEWFWIYQWIEKKILYELVWKEKK